MAEDELDEDMLDEEEEPEELDDDVDLEELEEDEELLAVEDDDVAVDLVVEEDDLEEDAAAVPAVPTPGDEEEELEEDEDVDVDDVEASLDEILKEKLVVEDEEEDEDEAPEVDERGETSLKVLPKQPDEFVCQSCFLVKHPSQLADPKRKYCRDCV